MADANYIHVEEKRQGLGPNVQNQHNVLHQITTLRTSTR